MKTLLALLFVAITACFITGCETTQGAAAVSNYNDAPLTVEVPTGLSDAQVQNVMGATLTGRQWVIESSSPSETVGTLDHRGYKAKVILERDGDTIRILSDATQVSAKTGEYVPAVPMGWLENLQKDMRKRFASASYSSFQ